MSVLSSADPMARTVVRTVREGDLAGLAVVLSGQPDAATLRIRDERGTVRTLLHVATDWPGYFPNGPAVARLLLAYGADPNVGIEGGTSPETPLHWAASSDDSDVAVALIDGGADLEAPGASIAGGPPLDDAVGYGCWHVARLLVSRGARVDRLWHAAALGLLTRLEELAHEQPPSAAELGEAFWQACHGGQRRAAERLLDLGADLRFVPGYAGGSGPLDIARSHDTRREALISWLEERQTRSSDG